MAITYFSSDFNGNEIRVSGALMVPQTAGISPMLSIQHGTKTRRDEVASVSALNSMEGVTALLTASLGYITCVPDYPGFGVSQTLHPYTHAASLAVSVIDLLRAARTYCENNNIQTDGRLFLTGYSEGGYATLAVHKELQQKNSTEFTVTAAAPMAGTYDLKGTADFLFLQPVYNYPANMAFFIYAYNQIYGWDRLEEIFRAPYAAQIPGLFDGTKTFAEINAQLPAQVDLLIQAQFISDYFDGQETEFENALYENSPIDWQPLAPMHFFHGDADDVAPYQNCLTAMDSLGDSAADLKFPAAPTKPPDCRPLSAPSAGLSRYGKMGNEYLIFIDLYLGKLKTICSKN